MEEAAKTIVSTVGQLAAEEFRRLRGVGGEVSRLRNELCTINALLRMQSEADEAAVNHFVREWMKQLREVGYDAQDCVDLYFLRVRSRPGDLFFFQWKRFLRTLWSRRRLAGDISDLRALASSINEQHGRYGVSLVSELGQGGKAAGPVSVPPAVLTASDSALRRADNPSQSQQPAVVTESEGALRPADNPGQSQQPVVVTESEGALCPADNPGQSQQSVFVGNVELAKNLADKVKALRSDVESDKQLKVFSIWGFGGLGKTTLAVEVCRLLEAEFPRQAKVSVSQTFSSKQDLQGLLRRLLRQIAQPKQTAATADPLSNMDTMDVDELEKKIKESVASNRYLILIDDVWSIQAWDAIRSMLPSSNCGSRIIVTTRIHTVAKACSSDANDDYIHRMMALDDKGSKQLFISKAFGSAGNPCPDDEELNDTMGSILKKCGGLPLAIVSIASLLASYKPPQGKEMWKLVQRSIGSQMETNPTLEGMRQILTLSYNHLPHHLKACMMYLSIFPEDYMACKDRLLRRWIAEGLVAEKRGMTQMEVAEGYFSELMSRSMIDGGTDTVTSYEKREEMRCRVHDMMLEIMASKSLEANFVSLVGGQYEGMSYTNTIRRLSIHGTVEASNNSSMKRKKNNVARQYNSAIVEETMIVQHVRSLSIFDTRAHTALLDRLGEFTLLRVLDLEDCKGLKDKHMKHICRMYLLRFLSLKGTDIKVMPRRVCDLEHLQTLDVRQTYLKRLPKTVVKLEKLEHLLFSNKNEWRIGWTLPRGISKMKALRQVHRAQIGNAKVAEEIGELDQLQELAVYVDTRNHSMKKLEVVAKNLACSLSKMYSLRLLDIGNFGCEKWFFKNIMNFLDKVESPPPLRYLRICGHFNKLPGWMGSLIDLVEVDLSWTYVYGAAQLFNILCKLPNLNRLSLGPYVIHKGQNMVFAKSQQKEVLVKAPMEEEIQEVAAAFPELKELHLGYSPEVPEVYKFEEGSMSKLEKLVVTFGDQWKKVIGLEHLTSLKDVQFAGYRGQMKDAVEQLERINEKREMAEKITVRLTYSD